MILEEMTMSEFKSALKSTKTLLVPYGTVEAHGTHLPLNTDTLIIYEAAKLAAKALPFFIAPADSVRRLYLNRAASRHALHYHRYAPLSYEGYRQAGLRQGAQKLYPHLRPRRLVTRLGDEGGGRVPDNRA